MINQIARAFGLRCEPRVKLTKYEKAWLYAMMEHERNHPRANPGWWYVEAAFFTIKAIEPDYFGDYYKEPRDGQLRMAINGLITWDASNYYMTQRGRDAIARTDCRDLDAIMEAARSTPAGLWMMRAVSLKAWSDYFDESPEDEPLNWRGILPWRDVNRADCAAPIGD